MVLFYNYYYLLLLFFLLLLGGGGVECIPEAASMVERKMESIYASHHIASHRIISHQACAVSLLLSKLHALSRWIDR